MRDTGQLIDNWQQLIQDEQDKQEIAESDEDTPPEFEKNQLPPVAVDDDFGARPGRASVLARAAERLRPERRRARDRLRRRDRPDRRHHRRHQRRSTPPAHARRRCTGRVTFGYTVSDGRGGTATAVVTVIVRSADENSAPEQVRATRALVAEGSRVSTSVLGDWVDPDGDAFYLSSASTGEPDSVSFKPAGIVVFQDGGGSTGCAVGSPGRVGWRGPRCRQPRRDRAGHHQGADPHGFIRGAGLCRARDHHRARSITFVAVPECSASRAFPRSRARPSRRASRPEHSDSPATRCARTTWSTSSTTASRPRPESCGSMWRHHPTRTPPRSRFRRRPSCAR